MGASLCSLHVPSGFGGKARSDVSMGCIFSQGLLAAATLVGVRAGIRGTTARARFKWELLLGSMEVTDLLRGETGIKRIGAGALKKAGFPLAQ